MKNKNRLTTYSPKLNIKIVSIFLYKQNCFQTKYQNHVQPYSPWPTETLKLFYRIIA